MAQHLLEYINSHENWKTELQGTPYYIQIKESGEYSLLKYQQLDSNFGELIVQECRGCIIKCDEKGKYQYVCRPFDKFFNYGEAYAAQIDWDSARVTEKIDGSLMKLWYDCGKWHLSTSGTIDAFQAPVADTEISFGEIFERILGTNIQEFGKELDTNYTYMFEMTSPESRVVIPYADGIYYLSRRKTDTGEEDFTKLQFDERFRIQYPKQYKLFGGLEDIIRAAKELTQDEEGYVVNDSKGRRIKVKSPAYLAASHMYMNGNLSEERIFRMIKAGTVDDLVAYFPQHQPMVQGMKDKIELFAEQCEKEWRTLRKQIAELIKDNPYRSYLFDRLARPETTPESFLLEKLTEKSAIQFLKATNNNDER